VHHVLKFAHVVRLRICVCFFCWCLQQHGSLRCCVLLHHQLANVMFQQGCVAVCAGSCQSQRGAKQIVGAQCPEPFQLPWQTRVYCIVCVAFHEQPAVLCCQCYVLQQDVSRWTWRMDQHQAHIIVRAQPCPSYAALHARVGCLCVFSASVLHSINTWVLGYWTLVQLLQQTVSHASCISDSVTAVLHISPRRQSQGSCKQYVCWL
jgi:hypothetical protein